MSEPAQQLLDALSAFGLFFVIGFATVTVFLVWSSIVVAKSKSDKKDDE